MLKLTCGMSQPLALKIFMPSISLLFSLQFIIMLHLGHSMTEHVLLAAFRAAAEGPTEQPCICWAVVPFPSLGCPSPSHSEKKLATKARWQLVLTWLCSVEMEKGKFIRGLLDLQPLCRTGIVLRAGKGHARRCGNYRLTPLLKKNKSRHSPRKKCGKPLSFPSQPKNQRDAQPFEQPLTEKRCQFNPSPVWSYPFNFYPIISFKIHHSHHLYKGGLRGKMGNNEVCWTMQAAEEAASCLEFPGFDDQVNFACLVASACWVMQCSKLSHCTKHDVSSHWCMKLKRCGLLGHPQINQTWFSVNLLLIIFKPCKMGEK